MGEHVSAKEIIINTTEPNFEYRENKDQIIIYDKDKNIDFMVFDKEEKFLSLDTFISDSIKGIKGMTLEINELQFIVKLMKELGWFNE